MFSTVPTSAWRNCVGRITAAMGCYDSHMAYDNDNIFARILRGELPAHVVLDEEHCLAFMDVMPQSPGHTLVIPRTPAQNVFELSDDDLSSLIVAARRVAVAVRAAFSPGGVTLMQLNGADAGQSVFHIHFHVIPRYDGEGLKFHAREVAEPEVLAAHAERIRAQLG